MIVLWRCLCGWVNWPHRKACYHCGGRQRLARELGVRLSKLPRSARSTARLQILIVLFSAVVAPVILSVLMVAAFYTVVWVGTILVKGSP